MKKTIAYALDAVLRLTHHTHATHTHTHTHYYALFQGTMDSNYVGVAVYDNSYVDITGIWACSSARDNIWVSPDSDVRVRVHVRVRVCDRKYVFVILHGP